MSWLADARVLYHLLARPVRGANHAERMENFYAGQADAYDDFRRRLLHGRRELLAQLPMPPGTVWVDLGAGTAANLEFIADRIPDLQQVYVVDLAESLLQRAQQRCQQHGWSNVRIGCADATAFCPDGPVDVVTFSYSLTMIPDWFAALDNAWKMLRPGGLIGVVDFGIARKYPAASRQRQGWSTRSFWPLWFAHDNVYLSADHLPYLSRRFVPLSVVEQRGPVPYLPLLRAPYYQFVGRKVGVE